MSIDDVDDDPFEDATPWAPPDAPLTFAIAPPTFAPIPQPPPQAPHPPAVVVDDSDAPSLGDAPPPPAPVEGLLARPVTP